jgi:transcriptional regulator
LTAQVQGSDHVVRKSTAGSIRSARRDGIHPRWPAGRRAPARAIQAQSDDVLIVDHGSLYPALQRLEDRGFIEAERGTSQTNRRARFYALTRKGRKELVHEESEWRRIASAIMRVLGTGPLGNPGHH